MLTWQNTGDPCTPETLTMVNGLVPTRIGYTARLTTMSDVFPTTPTYRIGALLLTNMSQWWAGGTAPSSVGSVSISSEIYPIEPIVSA